MRREFRWPLRESQTSAGTVSELAVTCPKKKPRGPRAPKPAHGIVGDSAAIREVHRLIRCYARHALPALVLGETGTGKELVARALHHEGPRKDGPFITVSCTNLPESMVEDELFGHKKGAFTGAADHRAGAFEAADGGTLFLDEVGDMPLSAQVKILRAVQEGKIRRLGENEERTIDVRVVAATNRDLDAMVRERTFREDLYQRLAYFVVKLPPLRDRGHDVLLICRHFLEKGHRKHGLPRRFLGRDCHAVLLTHRWDGNVRELERVVYQALATGRGPSLQAADLVRVLGGVPTLSLVKPCQVAAPPVLAALEAPSPLLAADLRSALGVSKASLARLVRPWIDCGRVVREGSGSALRYRLSEGRAGDDSDPRWSAIVAVAEREGRVTRRLVAELLGLCERSATRILGDMVKNGALVETGGKGRASGYRLPLQVSARQHATLRQGSREPSETEPVDPVLAGTAHP